MHFHYCGNVFHDIIANIVVAMMSVHDMFPFLNLHSLSRTNGHFRLNQKVL
jgi:hypothetical protein